MNTQRKMLLKIWGAVIIVFILGCITGLAISGLYFTKSAAPSSVHDTDAYFETLKREVKLTPEQEGKMRAILDEMRGEYKAVCAEVRPRYYNVRESARLRMRQLLTSEQQKSFDTIVTQDDCSCPETPK
jgi:hypothetical protein